LDVEVGYIFLFSQKFATIQRGIVILENTSFREYAMIIINISADSPHMLNVLYSGLKKKKNLKILILHPTKNGDHALLSL
jgi:hypothetical protein